MKYYRCVDSLCGGIVFLLRDPLRPSRVANGDIECSFKSFDDNHWASYAHFLRKDITELTPAEVLEYRLKGII